MRRGYVGLSLPRSSAAPLIICCCPTVQEASTATADTAAAAAAADATDLPALHRLAWLSKETPLVEERLDGIATKLAPAGEAVEALQQLVKQIEEEQVGIGRACAGRLEARHGRVAVGACCWQGPPCVAVCCCSERACSCSCEHKWYLF